MLRIHGRRQWYRCEGGALLLTDIRTHTVKTVFLEGRVYRWVPRLPTVFVTFSLYFPTSSAVPRYRAFSVGLILVGFMFWEIIKNLLSIAWLMRSLTKPRIVLLVKNKMTLKKKMRLVGEYSPTTWGQIQGEFWNCPEQDNVNRSVFSEDEYRERQQSFKQINWCICLKSHLLSSTWCLTCCIDNLTYYTGESHA